MWWLCDFYSFLCNFWWHVGELLPSLTGTSIHPHTHTRRRTHTERHTDTDTHTHTHTHMRAHTHTQAYVEMPPALLGTDSKNNRNWLITWRSQGDVIEHDERESTKMWSFLLRPFMGKCFTDFSSFTGSFCKKQACVVHSCHSLDNHRRVLHSFAPFTRQHVSPGARRGFWSWILIVDFHPQIIFALFPSFLAKHTGPKIRPKIRLFLKRNRRQNSATKSVAKSVRLGRKIHRKIRHTKHKTKFRHKIRRKIRPSWPKNPSQNPSHSPEKSTAIPLSWDGRPTVTPLRHANTGNYEMIMFEAFLFRVLPSFSPSQSVLFFQNPVAGQTIQGRVHSRWLAQISWLRTLGCLSNTESNNILDIPNGFLCHAWSSC